MKDTEFIELLNLYLDHEISAADAARLEAEVQSNPARRRIYHQYCRMQKACKVVAADFQTSPEQLETEVEKKVVAFDSATIAAASRRRRMNGFYTAGTFAALAACVAIVFIGRSRQASRVELAAGSPRTEVQVAAPIAVAVSPAAFAGATSPVLVSQRTLVADPLLLTGSAQSDAVFTAAVQQANNQLAWIEAVQLAPLPTRMDKEALYFDATLRPEGRALGQRSTAPARPAETVDEMVTFQFRK